MIIALIGNDGSGKSTLCTLTAAALAGDGYQARKLGEFQYPLLGALRVLAGIRPAARPRVDTQTGSTRTPFTRLLPYIMWLDTCLQTIFLKTFARRTYFLKDRCLYDYLATWRELGVNNGLIEFLYRIAPKPDVTFYISVDPATALQRRSAQTDKDSGKNIAFYELKRKVYDAIYARNPIMRIENDSTAEEAAGRIRSLLDTRERLRSHTSIALSGLDGAGKTTTATELATLLYRLHVRYVVVHFYYNYLLLKLFRLVKKTPAKTPEASHAQSLQTEKNHAAQGKSTVWVMFVLCDAAVQYVLFRMFAFKRLIVFDRFFHDYLVSFDFLQAPHNRNLLLRLFPKPDRYFLQIADHQVLHTRKPEHSPEFFAQCYESYYRLAHETGMVILDSTHQNPQQITTALLGKL